jgi:LysR family transcriptional regulator, transcriptional activator of nhaA
MEWLNYHHLMYFWVVAREGSVAKACKTLHLAQPTISGQIRALEKSLKASLFTRSGRALVLTETGRTVYQYADEIFSLGRELQDTLHNRPTGRAIKFEVGIADALPKLITHRLLQPAFAIPEEVQIACYDGDPDRLIAQLALHELDLVLSDVPANPRLGVRAYNHLLGECGVTFFGTEALARRYRKGFPRSLDGAPFLLPAGNVHLRRNLDQWFDHLGIRPRIRGEFSDSALLKVFGQFGDGLFAAHDIVAGEVKRMYHVSVVGHDESLRERFYAISVEKRIKHPAVLAISAAARDKLRDG